MAEPLEPLERNAMFARSAHNRVSIVDCEPQDSVLGRSGVSFEDRQILLGHRSGRMTTRYSAAELTKLIEAANSVFERDGNRPELVVLRRLSVS